MGGVVKAIKKAVKGVGKAVKKVVKGVVKVAKKVVSAVGDAMGKLGPIGTIALSFIAPYAIGALAGSSIGWVSTIGKGLQAIGSTIAAPFKALSSAAGNLLGGAVKGLGTFATEAGLNTIGSGLSTIGEKILTGIGTGVGGFEGVSDAFTKTWNGVSEAWGAANDAFATTMNGTESAIKTFDTVQGVDDYIAKNPDVTFESDGSLLNNSTGEVVGQFSPNDFAQGQASMLQQQTGEFGEFGNASTYNSTVFPDSTTLPADGEILTSGLSDVSPYDNASAVGAQGISPGGQQHEMLLNQEYSVNPQTGAIDPELSFGTQEMYDQGMLQSSTVQALGGVEVEPESTWDKLKDGLKSFGASELPDASGLLASNISTSGYDPLTSDSANGPGYAGQAQNFYMLNSSGEVVQSTGQTGIMGSMEYARQAGSLLSTTGNPYKYRWA